MNHSDTAGMNPRRIVVKVGTRLVAHANGKLNLNFIEKLVRELSDLRNRGLKLFWLLQVPSEPVSAA